MEENIKEVKKNIKDKWINAFPELSAFTQNKFYKITGCLVLGIEAVNIPNIKGYKPYFVIYPLWKEDIKKCLDTPILYICIENKKKIEISIPYIKHHILINEAIECFIKQIPISLNGNISLKSLFDFADSCFNDLLIKSNSAQQAKLFEFKFYTALYVGNEDQVKNILSQIKRASMNWNMRMFEMWYGKFEMWFSRLQEEMNSSKKFLKQVEINKQESKLSELKSSKIVL